MAQETTELKFTSSEDQESTRCVLADYKAQGEQKFPLESVTEQIDA